MESRRGVTRAAWQAVRLPFRVVGALITGAFRLGFAAGRLPVRAIGTTGKVLGFRGVVFGGLGLALGLLFAPVPGRELRERLMRLVSGAGSVSDDELVDKVTFELAHAPRTWHLEPQPTVAVVGGRVVLTGEVRDDDAADELVRVAAAIPGVAAVDSQLIVRSEPSSNGNGGATTDGQ